MYSCAIVISIWRWDLEFDMLITTNNRFFVRKCGGWCHYFKFAFKLVFFVKDVCRLKTEARKAEMEEFQASVLLVRYAASLGIHL